MTGGEDWLEWTWSIDWGTRWEEIRNKFEVARASAARNEPEHTITILDRCAVVGPGGGRLGKGSKGPYMPWRFNWDGLTLMLADRQDHHKNLPSLLVRADGLACLMAGAHNLWERAQCFVTALGGTIMDERLSRVDMCLDMPGQGIAPFFAAHQQGRYITRAKGDGYWRSPGISIYIGGAAPTLRIYDKLAESQRSGNEMKAALMCWHRWHGIEPNDAIRVEFELNRDALKKRGISSVTDYFTMRADLIEYLCTEWVRFTETVPDRRHTERAITMPLWEKVRQGFRGWAGAPTGQPLTPLPREACEVTALFRSMAGMLMTAAVRQGREFETIDGMLFYGMQALRAEFGRMDWRDRMTKKAAEYPSEWE